MCYSLYLVHWPIAVVMTNAFYEAGIRSLYGTFFIVGPSTIAVSILLSRLFYLVIERHFINVPEAPVKVVRSDPVEVGLAVG